MSVRRRTLQRWGGAILCRALSPFAAFAGAAVPFGAARANDLAALLHSGVAHGALGVRIDPTAPVSLFLLGLTAFATAIAILHVRARRSWNEHFEEQRALVADLQSRTERLSIFMNAEAQILINWDGNDGEPSVEGDAKVLGEGLTLRQAARFSDWLGPLEVSTVRTAVDKLRSRGESFSLTVNALSGALIEIEGKPVAGRAIMRLRAVTGERLERVRLGEKLEELSDLLLSLREMLDAIPQPVWLRDVAGRLVWVNAAYVQAVEAGSAKDVTDRSIALLERDSLERIETARRKGKPWRGEVQAVVAGRRRALDIVEVLAESGRSGGIATDVTELESARRDFEQQNAAHVRTLDQLPTAVALFGQDQRLLFANRAFNDLWQLDRPFLAGRPTDSEFLDRLRTDGKLPEQGDFREWKLGLQQSINANETTEDVWLLPSGRSLRVVTSPSTVGGIAYVFDDITEQMSLAQNYNRLASMQGETLDSLAEGVAMFGSHGRLQLHNPAFASLWELPGDVLARNPHIDDVARLCPPETQEIWRAIRGVVCGLPDERVPRSFEAHTTGGKVMAITLTPLPEGASLLTIEDTTSTFNAARMLKERNEALESAARFRSDFIQNVSFELRLPLTSVVGISQLLAAGTVGPLNERQRGYTADLVRSTDSVLALLNDILALTSIESNTLDLTVGGVDLRRSIGEATEGLKDRLGGAGVELRLEIAEGIGGILGDERRIRQILFNLIANAIAFADPGDTVVVSGRRQGANIEIRLADRGKLSVEAGPPMEGQRRNETGQNLRLSIVRSLVEVHNGRLDIQPRADGMREVLCLLPAAPGEPAVASLQ